MLRSLRTERNLTSLHTHVPSLRSNRCDGVTSTATIDDDDTENDG